MYINVIGVVHLTVIGPSARICTAVIELYGQCQCLSLALVEKSYFAYKWGVTVNVALRPRPPLRGPVSLRLCIFLVMCNLMIGYFYRGGPPATILDLMAGLGI